MWTGWPPSAMAFFAVAMTLLVLDIHLPAASKVHSEGRDGAVLRQYLGEHRGDCAGAS